MKYTENTLRRKARKAGYRIHKGFQHYLGDKSYPVWTNCYGEREVGYAVIDESTGFMVWDCYNEIVDHIWNLDDVEVFLKSVYEENGLVF